MKITYFFLIYSFARGLARGVSKEWLISVSNYNRNETHERDSTFNWLDFINNQKKVLEFIKNLYQYIISIIIE